MDNQKMKRFIPRYHKWIMLHSQTTERWLKAISCPHLMDNPFLFLLIRPTTKTRQIINPKKESCCSDSRRDFWINKNKLSHTQWNQYDKTKPKFTNENNLNRENRNTRQAHNKHQKPCSTGGDVHSRTGNQWFLSWLYLQTLLLFPVRPKMLKMLNKSF